MNKVNGESVRGEEGASEAKVFRSPEEILGMDDLEVVDIYVPEWKSWVHFRVMPANVAQAFQKSLDNPATKNDAWIRIFAYCAVNDDGKRMFTDQQLERLRTKSTRVFMRLQDQLLEINGFTKAKKDELKNGSGEADPSASPID